MSRLLCLLMLVSLLGCTSGPSSGRADPRLFHFESGPLQLEETSGAGQPGRYQLARVAFLGASDEKVTGRLHTPVSGIPTAGVLLLHGSGGRAADMDRPAEFLACSGVLALAIDAPNAGRGGAFVSFTDQDFDEQVELIQNLTVATDLLLDEYGVDQDQLGFVGHSYGAAMGSLFVGVEPRIDAAALLAGDGGLVAHFTEGEEPIVQLEGVSGIDEWLENMALIEPANFLSDASGAILMVSATHDALVDEVDSRAWHKAAPAGAEVEWVETGHGLDSPTWERSLGWLLEELGVPADVGGCEFR